MLIKTLKQLKKLLIAVSGFIVLAIGVIMLVTPGPSIIVIPAGLAILATEFVWARNMLNKLKDKLKRNGKAPLK